MKSLAAVQAGAQGDEDGGVGCPDGRPGWAGWAKRIPCFQAPGSNPVHNHEDRTWSEEEEKGGKGGRGGGHGEPR